jgi:hypothetical protein
MFWRTRVTINRPYSGLTPLGVMKVTIDAETEAGTGEEAKASALSAALELVANLDHVTSIDTEITG